MKKNVISLFVLALIVCTSCQETIDFEKEKEAIKAVIENESNSYLAKNFDQQMKSFLQDESFVGITAGKNGYHYIQGWDEIMSGYKDSYESSPDPSTDKLEFKNYKIKVYTESAWAIYDQIKYDNEGEFINKNLQVRFLEKKDGEWKIVYLSVVFTTSYEENIEEGELESETESTD